MDHKLALDTIFSISINSTITFKIISTKKAKYNTAEDKQLPHNTMYSDGPSCAPGQTVADRG